MIKYVNRTIDVEGGDIPLVSGQGDSLNFEGEDAAISFDTTFGDLGVSVSSIIEVDGDVVEVYTTFGLDRESALLLKEFIDESFLA